MRKLNDNKIELSVIVPLYNAEKTLPKCLTSIQSNRNINLEIILVDDESTDKTMELCKKYSCNDSRIKVLQKKNGGVASARNSGLEIATGTYVTFVDQDDWIEKNAYSVMLESGLKEEADMIVCNYTKDYGEDVRPMTNRRPIADNISSAEELIMYAFFREEYRGFAAFVWNKLFKRELLNKNKISFDDSLKRGDDVLFYSKIAVTAPKTVYMDAHFYHYVQREDSITHTLTRENLHRLAEILSGYEKAIAVLEENHINADAVNYLKCFYVYHASNLYELSYKEKLWFEKKYFIKCMQKYLAEYKEQNINYPERIKRIEYLIEEEK